MSIKDVLLARPVQRARQAQVRPVASACGHTGAWCGARQRRPAMRRPAQPGDARQPRSATRATSRRVALGCSQVQPAAAGQSLQAAAAVTASLVMSEQQPLLSSLPRYNDPEDQQASEQPGKEQSRKEWTAETLESPSLHKIVIALARTSRAASCIHCSTWPCNRSFSTPLAFWPI